jgi:membrane protein implicated in regulation of membrane protease activity
MLCVALGVAVAATSLLGLDRVALALLGVGLVTLTVLLAALDRRNRDRILAGDSHSRQNARQLGTVNRDIRRLVIDVEETQRRLVTSIETLRFENAERARSHSAESAR